MRHTSVPFEVGLRLQAWLVRQLSADGTGIGGEEPRCSWKATTSLNSVPRSATRNSTWSRCRSPSQGCGRRRRSARVADERGDHVKDAERLWNPVKTRKRRREGLHGGSVHMNVSSRTTTATWLSMYSKTPSVCRRSLVVQSSTGEETSANISRSYRKH